ncbi:MAG: MazG nucleotide pyrophosphohydrolase domain-containing protein [Candidatus Nanohalobium sp.]
MEEQQEEVEEFMEKHGMEGTPEFRIMDLVSEVGEVVGDATKSADYGLEKDKLDVKQDEIGDVLFSLFAVCNSLDIDAEEALETALDKYERRIEEKGDAGSR